MKIMGSLICYIKKLIDSYQEININNILVINIFYKIFLNFLNFCFIQLKIVGRF